MSNSSSVIDGDLAQPNNREAAEKSRAAASCRFCGAPLSVTFVDLGMSPLCESFLSANQINKMEPFYPLRVFVCSNCFLSFIITDVPNYELARIFCVSVGFAACGCKAHRHAKNPCFTPAALADCPVAL